MSAAIRPRDPVHTGLTLERADIVPNNKYDAFLCVTVIMISIKFFQAVLNKGCRASLCRTLAPIVGYDNNSPQRLIAYIIVGIAVNTFLRSLARWTADRINKANAINR